MLSPLLLLLSFSALTRSATIRPRTDQPWSTARFNSLITFGDSYTDENRLTYFFINGNTEPPPGTLLPETFRAPSGGRTWPRYVVQYTGREVGESFVPELELYNYAVSGAVCSNEVTPR